MAIRGGTLRHMACPSILGGTPLAALSFAEEQTLGRRTKLAARVRGSYTLRQLPSTLLDPAAG